MGVAGATVLAYIFVGSGCRLVAVPAFKAVWGAIALFPVGSIPTPSVINNLLIVHVSVRPIPATTEFFLPVEHQNHAGF